MLVGRLRVRDEGRGEGEGGGLDSHHTSCCFQLMSLSDCLHWLKWNLHQNAHKYSHVPSDSVVCGVVGCELGIRTCFVPL